MNGVEQSWTVEGDWESVGDTPFIKLPLVDESGKKKKRMNVWIHRVSKQVFMKDPFMVETDKNMKTGIDEKKVGAAAVYKVVENNEEESESEDKSEL